MVPVRSHAVNNLQPDRATADLSVSDPRLRLRSERPKFERSVGVAHRRNSMCPARNRSPSAREDSHPGNALGVGCSEVCETQGPIRQGTDSISLKKGFHREEEEPDSNREPDHCPNQERDAGTAIDGVGPQRYVHSNSAAHQRAGKPAYASVTPEYPARLIPLCRERVSILSCTCLQRETIGLIQNECENTEAV